MYYDPYVKEFSGLAIDLKKKLDMLPTILQSFGTYWNCNVLWKIRVETNHYTTEELVWLNDDGVDEIYICSGKDWHNFEVKELKAFLAFSL